MAGSSTCLNAAVPGAARRPGGHPLPARHRRSVHHRDRDQHDRCRRRLAGRPALRRRSGRPSEADYARLDAEAGAVPARRRRRGRAAGPRRWRADRSRRSRRVRRAVPPARPGGAGSGGPRRGRLRDRRPARPAALGRRPGHRAARLRRRHPPGVVDPDQGRRAGIPSGPSRATRRWRRGDAGRARCRRLSRSGRGDRAVRPARAAGRAGSGDPRGVRGKPVPPTARSRARAAVRRRSNGRSVDSSVRSGG